MNKTLELLLVRYFVLTKMRERCKPHKNILKCLAICFSSISDVGGGSDFCYLRH